MQRTQGGQYGVLVDDAYRSTVGHLAEAGLNIKDDYVMNGATEQAP